MICKGGALVFPGRAARTGRWPRLLLGPGRGGVEAVRAAFLERLGPDRTSKQSGLEVYDWIGNRSTRGAAREAL